jgi:hypothetical protein
MKATKFFFVEVTDTFGGEANYGWVARFKVRASTVQGAIRKVSTEVGLAARKEYDTGDMARYNFKDACVCAFVMDFDAYKEQYPRIVTI